MRWDHFTAADAFALGMIGVIASGFGVLLVLFLAMKRNAARRNPEVDALLQSLKDEPTKAKASTSSEAPREPWEKPADWWRAGS